MAVKEINNGEAGSAPAFAPSATQFVQVTVEAVPSGSGSAVVPSGSGSEVVPSGSGSAVVPSGSGSEVVPSGSGSAVVPKGSGSSLVAAVPAPKANANGAVVVDVEGKGENRRAPTASNDEPRPGPSSQMYRPRVELEFDVIHQMSDEEVAPVKPLEQFTNFALLTPEEKRQHMVDIERDLLKFRPLDSFNIELRRWNFIITPVIDTSEPRMAGEDLPLENQKWTADSERGHQLRKIVFSYERLTFSDEGKDGSVDKMTMILPILHPCIDTFANRIRMCKIYYMHPAKESPICIGSLKIKDGGFAATLTNAFTGKKYIVHRSFRASKIPYVMFSDTAGIIKGWTKGVKEDPGQNPKVWTEFHLKFTERFIPVIDKALMLAASHAWISDRRERKKQKCCSRFICFSLFTCFILLATLLIVAAFKED